MVSPVAKRYGLAIFELAIEKGFLEELLQALEGASAVFDDPEVREFFKNPLIPVAEKKSAIEKMVDSDREEIKNFFELLLKKNRILFLPEIYEYVLELKLQRENKVPVEVVSAFELDESELEKIAESVKKLLGADVIVSTSVDPTLIGGVIVKFRDVVIDGSLRRYLTEIKKIIKKGKR